jgi:hypothetical protein
MEDKMNKYFNDCSSLNTTISGAIFSPIIATIFPNYNDYNDYNDYYNNWDNEQKNVISDRELKEKYIEWIKLELTRTKELLNEYEQKLWKFSKGYKNRIHFLSDAIHTYTIALTEKEIEYDSLYGTDDIKEAYREIEEITKSNVK